MDIEQQKSRTRKWIIAYLIFIAVMFIAMFTVHWLFIIPTAVLEFIVSLMFKDLKKLEENNEDVAQKNIKINQEENKVEKTNEEKALLLEVLSKDEELNLFLKVTNGQAKFTLFEKLRAELEAKPEKKEVPKEVPKEEKPKQSEKDSKVEDEEIVVEE